MNKESIERIVNAVTKECEKNFNEHKVEGYTLANKTTIPFVSKTVNSRKVSDWGADEDEDEIICYSEEGWEKFYITVQVGAGIQKVVSQGSNKLGKNEIVDMINAMDLLDQVKFIHSAYSILQFSEFKSELA